MCFPKKQKTTVKSIFTIFTGDCCGTRKHIFVVQFTKQFQDTRLRSYRAVFLFKLRRCNEHGWVNQ